MPAKLLLSRYYNLSPDSLAALGFTPYARFSHLEVGRVVFSFLKRNSPWRNFYLLSTCAVGLGYLYWVVTNNFDYARMTAGLWFVVGMGVIFPLIPLHEGLHLLAYRLVGARKLFVEAHWKKGYFLAGAPNFIADARSFLFVAFLPFVVITTLHLVFIFAVQAEWVTLLWGSLFMHTMGCLGDFAMVDFFTQVKEGEVVTYDTEDGFTVFLVRSPGAAAKSS